MFEFIMMFIYASISTACGYRLGMKHGFVDGYSKKLLELEMDKRTKKFGE